MTVKKQRRTTKKIVPGGNEVNGKGAGNERYEVIRVCNAGFLLFKMHLPFMDVPAKGNTSRRALPH
jgi:hypothetical protein